MLSALLLIPVCILHTNAADVRLKNGTILHGDLFKLRSISDKATGVVDMKHVKETDPIDSSIARVDNGWQHFYFPMRQRVVEDRTMSSDVAVPNPVTFDLPCPKRQGSHPTATSFGAFTTDDPFSEFGWRRVRIESPTGGINVFQAISEVTPDHVMVKSINYHWNMGLPLKSIPTDSLEKLLKRQVQWDNAAARVALARFYMQAEYFAEAMAELSAILNDFPDQRAIVEKCQIELMNYFGGYRLRRIKQMKQAGQYAAAQALAEEVIQQPIDSSILKELNQERRAFDLSRQMIEKARIFLLKWESDLKDSELQKRLRPLRQTISQQLSFDTLSRLELFLDAEFDDQYDSSQRLSLAYSGWLLGLTNAVPDLDQTLAVWDAHNAVVQYLQSDDPSLDARLIKQLQAEESITSETVLNLIADMPPFLDAGDIQPGIVHHIEKPNDDRLLYSVVLPAEYSTTRSYPLVVALRSRDRSVAQTLSIWAGDEAAVDRGVQRGYIVIVPEVFDEKASEYTPNAAAHDRVLQSLIDARKRFRVDSDRVFLVGHGRGADAAYDIGMAHPDEFAGVIPLGGNFGTDCSLSWENGRHTAWYAIGKGYDCHGERDHSCNALFDKIMKQVPDYDFMLVEYLGHNGEYLTDEIPMLFDWMDLHVRPKQEKHFKIRSLHRTNGRFFWISAAGLPDNDTRSFSSGKANRPAPMDIEVRATESNTIHLRSPTENYTLRLTPELIDFGRRLIVKINDHVEFNGFVKPDIGVMLDEFRNRGDRRRLPLVVLSP